MVARYRAYFSEHRPTKTTNYLIYFIVCKLTLENTEGAIKNEQSRETDNIGNTKRRGNQE